MNYFKEKGLLWFGMLFAFALVLIIVSLSWSRLVHWEASHYGKELVERLRTVISEIDHDVDFSFTPTLYNYLHQQPLAKLHLNKNTEVTQFVNRIVNRISNWHGVVSMFTDCPETNKALCYERFALKTAIYKPIIREGYDPKSRPWYIATRSHTDWIVLNFMIRSSSRESGYPTTWGIGIVKHILADSSEEIELTKRASHKEIFATQLKNEHGIWLLLNFATSNLEYIKGEKTVPDFPFLNMLYAGKTHPFQEFDVYFRAIRFSPAMLAQTKPLKTTCDVIKKFKGLSYQADVVCQASGEPIHFLFTKKYDHPTHFIILGCFGLILLYGFYYFLCFVYQQNKTIEKNRQKQKLKKWLENIHQFPKIDNHVLLPLSKSAYTEFVKETYGGFPQMARAKGFDLNHIYRVNRKFKHAQFIVFKYDTIKEMVGSYSTDESNEQIRKLLVNSEILQQEIKKS